MAVLAVPYGPEAKSDSRPDTLEMAMIEAASLRSRCGIAARTSRTVCMRSTLRLACQFSSVSGMARALTLATTTSSPPNAVGGLLHPRGERVAVADVERRCR